MFNKKIFKSKLFYNILIFISIFLLFPLLMSRIYKVLNSNPGSSYENKAVATTVKADEQRGIWFSYLEWAKFHNGKNEQEWTNTIANEIIPNLKSLKINNIYIHAVAHSDSFYPSNLLPAAKEVVKEYGKDLTYDPFKVFLIKLKENNIKVHAWVNPLRGMRDENFSKIPDSKNYFTKSSFIKQNKSDYYMKDNVGMYWFNPGNPEVLEHIKRVTEEIIDKYPEIEGIHIDDYFYPSVLHENKALETDISYFQKTQPKEMDIHNWRRGNITALVKKMYDVCCSKNKIFGVSPIGNIGNNFNVMYFDTEEILRNGYLHYIIPQIFYGFENGTLSFVDCATKWKDLMLKYNKINFYVGLAAYKCGIEKDFWAGAAGAQEWKNHGDVLKRQIETLRNNGFSGFVFFSYESFFAPKPELAQKITEERNNFMPLLQ